MKYAKLRKTRNRRRRQSRKHRRTAHRKRKAQKGGGFSYTIPDSAIVRWRSLDDDGTQPPVLLFKSDADKAQEEMEHI